MLEMFSSALMPGFDSKEALGSSDPDPVGTEPTSETDKAKGSQGEASDVEQVNRIQTEKTAEVKEDGSRPFNVGGEQTLRTKVEQLDKENSKDDVKMDPQTLSVSDSQNDRVEL